MGFSAAGSPLYEFGVCVAGGVIHSGMAHVYSGAAGFCMHLSAHAEPLNLRVHSKGMLKA